MIVEVHFDSCRESESGVKQEFLAQVDEPFKDDIEIVDVHDGQKHETVPANVKFRTEADEDVMVLEAQYFMSAKYGDASATVHP